MSEHFADRLTKAILDKKTPVCVGIDPLYNRLPKQIITRKDLNDENDAEVAVDAIFDFSVRVLRVVAPIVPAVKINIAFFEKYLWEGVESYYSLIQEAEDLDLEIIGDVKRGDIGSTAQAYAEAHLKTPEFVEMEDIVTPDAITINGFAGIDGIAPFAETALQYGKGVFVWTRASNPSAAAIQDFADANGKKFFELLAKQVATLACEPKYMGKSGFSDIGMVVGGTAAEQAKQLRQQYPHILFLVPGYGAQGAAAQDCLHFCKDGGTGALISASRSVLYAYENPKYKAQFGENWEKCIEQACLDMKQELSA